MNFGFYETAPGYGYYYSLPVDSFQTSKTLTDPVLSKQYRIAFNLLEAFRNRKLSARRVFDIKKMAIFMALCDLLGGHHALIANNFRFYYNPVTSKLEPIPFDLHPGIPSTISFSNDSSTATYQSWGCSDCSDSEARFFLEEDASAFPPCRESSSSAIVRIL